MESLSRIPGTTITVTNVYEKNGDMVADFELQITNYWRLLFWYVRTYYDLRWYQWSYALWLIIVGTFRQSVKLNVVHNG